MKVFQYSALCVVNALASCGGGESSPSPSEVAIYPSLETTTIDATSELISIVPSSNGVLTVTSGELTGTSGQVVLGSRTGELNSATGEVVFNDGSVLQLRNAPTEFVRIHDFQNFSADAGFGVIGAQTHATDLPSREATYSLQDGGIVAVNAGTSFYSLQGDVRLVVDFEDYQDNSLTLEIDGLDGQVFTQNGEETQVFDVLDLTITNVSVENGTFSGGDLQFDINETNGDLSPLSGEETLLLEGGFFGPEGIEVGGAFTIDDTLDGGSMIVTGAFVALQ